MLVRDVSALEDVLRSSEGCILFDVRFTASKGMLLGASL